jgi:antitoxin VapB
MFRGLEMTKTTLFRSSGSQAVHLSGDVAFPEGVRSVTVLRDGKRRIITPSDIVWDDFFDAPTLQDREAL